MNYRNANGKTRVFVYGTLMRGEPNHRLLSHSEFVGDARTGPEFDMVDLGLLPGMVEGGHTLIYGEMYDVSTATLQTLDKLEGHPNFYRRRRIKLQDAQEVSTYLFPAEKVTTKALIETGDWRDKRKGGKS